MVVKVIDNKFDFRLQMVRHALATNVSDASRVYGRSRKTVRKWRDRYLSEGYKGLNNRSRKPHHSPNKTSLTDRQHIGSLRHDMPHIGAERLHHEFGVKQCGKTIQKIIRELGLAPKKKSKRQKQRDLREWKRNNFKPLRFWDVDTKDCSDIPYYLERIHNGGFPRYLYQARDVRTNTLFSAYAHELSNWNSHLFIKRLFEHLRSLGIPLNELEIQTDNGTEYAPARASLAQSSAFEKAILAVDATHVRIPPGACNYQSDVERANGLIEYELLEIERWQTTAELVALTSGWEYYFNRLRPNSYQKYQSPFQRMQNAGVSETDAENTCLWTVTILDDRRLKKINFLNPVTGYHVCKSDVELEFPPSSTHPFHLLYTLI